MRRGVPLLFGTDHNNRGVTPENEVSELSHMDDGVVVAALEIAAQRRAILARMKSALLRNDVPSVLRCAGEVCGVPSPDTSAFQLVKSQ